MNFSNVSLSGNGTFIFNTDQSFRPRRLPLHKRRREKRYFEFKPKDCEKREVPISAELVAQLIARKNGSSLIFGKQGRPDGHLLRRLKNVAFSGPFGIVIDPSGRFAYVANEGVSSVTGYTIDASTGALESLPGSPFLGVEFPLGITMDSSGNYVYLPSTGQNAVSAFQVNSTTGALTPVAGSPFPAGSGPFSVTVVPKNQ